MKHINTWTQRIQTRRRATDSCQTKQKSLHMLAEYNNRRQIKLRRKGARERGRAKVLAPQLRRSLLGSLPIQPQATGPLEVGLSNMPIVVEKAHTGIAGLQAVYGFRGQYIGPKLYVALKVNSSALSRKSVQLEQDCSDMVSMTAFRRDGRRGFRLPLSFSNPNRL